MIVHAVSRCIAPHGHMIDELADETFGNIEITFVFGEIALSVCLIEQLPLLRREIERVLKTLKNQNAVFASITVQSQCAVCRCMRGVVGQIEAAFDRENWLLRIL